MIAITRPRAFAFSLVATLALAGCGSSDKAGDAVSAETVELPAEAAMSGADAAPVADPSANATPTTTEGVAAAAGAAAADVAAAAGEAAPAGSNPAYGNKPGN